MIQIREYLTTKIIKPSKIKASNKTIRKIVKEEMDKYGHDCDLNHIDMSEVTNMDGLFSCHYTDLGESYSDLNPDISEWNVSNVTIVKFMFYECKNFNCDISNWNVSNVTLMKYMFYGCTIFNQPLDNWDVSNVENMEGMFWHCTKFNYDLSKWNVSNVQSMNYMFDECTSFNQDISMWNVDNVEEEYYDMFNNCPIEEKYKPHFKE